MDYSKYIEIVEKYLPQGTVYKITAFPTIPALADSFEVQFSTDLRGKIWKSTYLFDGNPLNFENSIRYLLEHHKNIL